MNQQGRKIFLTLFYSGLSKKAPGTVGSFVALILGFGVLYISSPTTLFLLSMLITVVAIKEINIYEDEVGTHDNSEIVIDELAGMWIAMSIGGVLADGYLLGFIAFIFFRIFDIWKPSIIGKIDRDVGGGMGVMGDDVVAGIFAGLCTALVNHLIITFI
ncbi:MAG: phosphatidylglycerophosphatase A [Arcobacteraceae bacterium]|jgi:phosphatidylglycerophosphatase A|nr:phosphatidylglycerophosphatase A [Arcobacteraceae bacterium]